MNRRCKRCESIQNIDKMHYNKQCKGWLCNNRLDCLVRLNAEQILAPTVKAVDAMKKYGIVQGERKMARPKRQAKMELALKFIKLATISQDIRPHSVQYTIEVQGHKYIGEILDTCEDKDLELDKIMQNAIIFFTHWVSMRDDTPVKIGNKKVSTDPDLVRVV